MPLPRLSACLVAIAALAKRSDTRASVWGSQDAADAARRDNERAAFGELVESLAGSWPKLLDRYARRA